MNCNLTPYTILRIEALIEAIFAGRDELAAAATTLDDPRHDRTCRQLSDMLDRHAVELRQLLLPHGKRLNPPADVLAQSIAFFEFAKARNGAAGVLRIAANCYRLVRDQYDMVLDTNPESSLTSTLHRQRLLVEVGCQTLHTLREILTYANCLGRNVRTESSPNFRPQITSHSTDLPHHHLN